MQTRKHSVNVKTLQLQNKDRNEDHLLYFGKLLRLSMKRQLVLRGARRAASSLFHVFQEHISLKTDFRVVNTARKENMIN